MSRIHEALKKAEQERTASQGSPEQPEFAASADPAVAAPEEPAAPVAEEISSNRFTKVSHVPPFSSPFSLEALAARCPPLQWRPDNKTMLFFNGDDNARGTEEFRTLRSRLYNAREKMAVKKVLVTSALPKEGKSFTAANLAQVLVRQHGRRVLLIDADLRSPRLHIMLGTTASPGLADYLQGTSDEFSIVQRGPVENFFFVPSGEEISNPAELVANGRLNVFLQRVEAIFDWIIIDSPPAVPVSDASQLAKDCDGVLMVVRSNATPIDMARRAREEFAPEVLLGVVLNGTDEVVGYSRYYYEKYGSDGTKSKS